MSSPLCFIWAIMERTKGHLVAVLTALESKDAMDVHALLKALQTTLRFEQEMATRFGITVTTLATTTTNATTTTTTTNGSSSGSPIYPGSSTASNNDKEERRLKSQDKLMYVFTHRLMTVLF